MNSSRLAEGPGDLRGGQRGVTLLENHERGIVRDGSYQANFAFQASIKASWPRKPKMVRSATLFPVCRVIAELFQ